jgi:hypothetical protein
MLSQNREKENKHMRRETERGEFLLSAYRICGTECARRAG